MDSRDPTRAAAAAAGTVELRGGRPEVDRVRMEAARARSEQALFATAAPARVGRYVVLDTAGSGGMGIVYRAYDPQLDRKVALKVVTARGAALDAARARLRGEARALAQLAHPNVVPVHDVLVLGDDLVVVMELVEGITLDAWARRAPRRPAETVAIYAQAARGLAAAHDVGVIHRDFKPANALVGEDGRVRVVDFGLARLAAAAPPEPVAAVVAAPRQPALTAAGAVIGTPAYMAPEQLAAAELTPAADQFSFWVSLYEAVAGVRPFAASDPEAMLAAIRAGKLAAPSEGRIVPGWLRQLAQRGLAFEPAERLPSMHEVAGELLRVRGWRRARVPLALCALGAIATVAVVRGQTAGDPLAPCDGGGGAIDGAWSAVPRARVQATLAKLTTPYAREVEGLVLGGLDRYRAAWTELHRGSCVAHRRGEMSPQLLDRSMACLQRRGDDLRAAVQVLGETDSTTLGNAVDVVARLLPIAACGDLESLAADAPPIADAARRAEVAAARARLGHATALDAAGRSAAAVTEAGEVLLAAERLDYPPLIVDAELLVGRSRIFGGEYQQALAPLQHAEELALANRELAAGVVAAARRIYAEGMLGHDVAGLEREGAVLEPLSRSVASDPLARPLLFNNLGGVHVAGERRDLAVRDFEAAQRAMATIAHPDPELIFVSLNLATLTAEPARRAVLARSAWQRLRDLLGPSHTQTLVAQFTLANDLADPREAWAVITEVCERYDRDHAEMVASRGACLYSRAFLAAHLGDSDAAVHDYRSLAALAGSTDVPSLALKRALARGEIALVEHDLAGARTAFDGVVTTIGLRPPWWKLAALVHGRIGLARCALARGDRRTASAELDRALAEVDSLIPRSEFVVPRLLRDWARRVRDDVGAPP